MPAHPPAIRSIDDAVEHDLANGDGLLFAERAVGNLDETLAGHDHRHGRIGLELRGVSLENSGALGEFRCGRVFEKFKDRSALLAGDALGKAWVIEQFGGVASSLILAECAQHRRLHRGPEALSGRLLRLLEEQLLHGISALGRHSQERLDRSHLRFIKLGEIEIGDRSVSLRGNIGLDRLHLLFVGILDLAVLRLQRLEERCNARLELGHRRIAVGLLRCRRDDDGRGLLGVIEGKGENERKQHEFEHKYS